jgi:hypothetical protein
MPWCKHHDGWCAHEDCYDTKTPIFIAGVNIEAGQTISVDPETLMLVPTAYKRKNMDKPEDKPHPPLSSYPGHAGIKESQVPVEVRPTKGLDWKDAEPVVVEGLENHPAVQVSVGTLGLPRETHPTGAVREVKEERYDLIPTEPIRLLAVHYGRGAKKYAERNWEKGLPWSNPFNSARRHMDKWLDGEDIDPDPVTQAHHLIAAIWNLVALVEFSKTHPELDDRKGTE